MKKCLCRAWNSLKFTSNANGTHRNYLFKMNIMEEIFEIISCREILENKIKICTIYQYMFYS